MLKIEYVLTFIGSLLSLTTVVALAVLIDLKSDVASISTTAAQLSKTLDEMKHRNDSYEQRLRAVEQRVYRPRFGPKEAE